MSTETVDLHGHEKLPFPNFNEDGTYLEAVTLPKEEDAIERLRQEGFDTEPPLARVFMRYIDTKCLGERVTEIPGWYECAENAPGALPFWKDAP